MKKINFFTPINTLGYGVVGKNLALELNKYFEVCLVPLFNQMSGVEKEELSIIKEMINRVNTIDFNSPGLMWNYGNQMWGFCGNQRFGYTIFETEFLSSDWVHQLKQLDKVFVPTEWAKNILINNYSINAEIMHCGVNLGIFRPIPPTAKNDKFRFCSIGKWEKRKNQSLLIEAFCEEFKQDENVELYGLWTNPFYPKDVYNEARSYVKNGHIMLSSAKEPNATIFFCNPFQSSHHLAGFMNQMDAFAFPYRAEGWCLPLLEAMACKKPCIATNYSAPTEFINEKNTYLLKDLKFVPADDGMYFNGNLGNWAEINKEELKHLLRQAYNNNDSRNNTIANEAYETAKYFRWENVGIRTKEKLEKIVSP